MKKVTASILLLAFTLSAILPIAYTSGVSAQTSYSISQVDHSIEIMYSGNVVVLDTIHISGTVTDGFTIGIPYAFSTGILKVIAYDSNHVFEVDSGGIQLGNHTGFYAVQVNFNGYAPSEFTVAFILSNGVVIDQGSGNFIVAFPAYPSLTQTVGTCNVQLTAPSTPSQVSIGKEDGNVTATTYKTNNLEAYTYSVAEANVKVTTGTIESSKITNLDREINIDTMGNVNAVDTYHIISNATTTLGAYVLSLPQAATNIDVRDSFGSSLTTSTESSSNMLLVNATFQSSISSGQITIITVRYNLPGATLQGSEYVLSDFQLFANYKYIVEHATMRFNLPEGATINTPDVGKLDSSSTLTRSTYKDTLIIAANYISFVDFLAPQANNIQLSYQYSPVWVSFGATFWAALVAALCCVGAVVYRQRKPKEEVHQTRTAKTTPHKTTAPTTPIEVVKGSHITADNIRDFIDTYEDKKQLNAELRAMDIKAQKGKIPRRQYKVQRATVENRIESLNRSIERSKATFRGTTGTYQDLMNQLDVAEADLTDAEETIRTLEERQSRGEISIESYKRNIADAQKTRDKAESSINGILLRLREKIR